MADSFEVCYTVDHDAEALARRASAYFRDRILESVQARGRARVAISGGSTPKPTFELLAVAPLRGEIPWEKLEIYWVDERVLPPGDPGSNYGMTRAALLDKVPVNPSQVFRIHGELEPAKAAAEYEAVIRRNFRLEGAELPVFDLIALGMGPDGHTASLFPHSAGLGETLRIAVANEVNAPAYPWRVTLTWPVINRARNVFFLIAGEDKAKPLREVLLGRYQPEVFPSQLIHPASGRLTLLLDGPAAALLPATGADHSGKLEIAR